MKKLLQILAVVLIFSACQKEIPVDGIESSNIIENPAPPPSQQGQNAKAFVVKFASDQIGTFYPVPNKDITLVINIDFKEACDGNFPVPTVLDLHQVIKQEAGLPRIHEVFSGNDVHLEIWDFAYLSSGLDCDPFDEAGDPSYSGLVTLHGTDNDVLPFDDHDPNRNTFGFVASNDEISVVLRGGWDGYHNDTWKVQVCKIRYK